MGDHNYPTEPPAIDRASVAINSVETGSVEIIPLDICVQPKPSSENHRFSIADQLRLASCSFRSQIINL